MTVHKTIVLAHGNAHWAPILEKAKKLLLTCPECKEGFEHLQLSPYHSDFGTWAWFCSVCTCVFHVAGLDNPAPKT